MQILELKREKKGTESESGGWRIDIFFFRVRVSSLPPSSLKGPNVSVAYLIFHRHLGGSPNGVIGERGGGGFDRSLAPGLGVSRARTRVIIFIFLFHVCHASEK